MSRSPLCVLICLSVFLIIKPDSFAGSHSTLTPNDVYSRVMILKQQTEKLRELRNVSEDWPVIPVQSGKHPRHVLRKTLEVLEKINRLRKIYGLGEISIPTYPSRPITPNEVHDMVERLKGEMDILIRMGFKSDYSLHPEAEFTDKTPNDVYRALWSVSNALDSVLGIRGFHAGDVYAKSIRVLEEVRTLRKSQELAGNVPLPKLTSGKHPNHALSAAYDLLGSIATAEKNLWMEPVKVPSVPRRVISPPEVYDALQIVAAELQRIKYRLGVEHYTVMPPVEENRTSDDVIQNLVLAKRLMPDFSSGHELIQYSKEDLVRTPGHVYAATRHIIEELERYRSYRNITTTPRKTVTMKGLRPVHVYHKTVEVLEKTNRVRAQAGLGPIQVPSYPFREITPTEVFDIVTRLDSELEIVYEHNNMEIEPWYKDVMDFTGKTPSDVYDNMWQISYLLDTLMDSKGYTPTDVYKTSKQVIYEIREIAGHLGIEIKETETELRPGLQPSDVIEKTHEILLVLKQVQHRAGMSRLTTPVLTVASEITPNDVFNQVQVLRAEIHALKIHLGINKHIASSQGETGEKTPSHVYRNMESIQTMLLGLLNGRRAEHQ